MLTPLDIQKKEFEKTFRGYDTEEVDEFISSLKADYEELYTENIEIKDKMEMLSDRVRYYSSMEDSLKETLILAQGTASDVVNAAQEKAELIIEEAEFVIKKEESEARDKLKGLNSEYEELKEEINRFRKKFVLFLESQLLSAEELNITEEDKIEENTTEENTTDIEA